MKQRLSALALMVVLGSTLTAAHEPTKAKTAVEVTLWGSDSDGKSWTQTFSLKKKITNGKFTVTYFSKEEKVNVPEDVEVGVGL